VPWDPVAMYRLLFKSRPVSHAVAATIDETGSDNGPAC
jgi:hypothetical protein